MTPKNKFSSYHYGVTCCGSSCCGHLPWNEHLTKGCGDNSKFYHLKLGWLDFVPSGFANLCAPVGATIIGDGILYPNKLVDMSILLTSIRTRGRNLCNRCQKVRAHFLMRFKSIGEANNTEFFHMLQYSPSVYTHPLLPRWYNHSASLVVLSWRVLGIPGH